MLNNTIVLYVLKPIGKQAGNCIFVERRYRLPIYIQGRILREILEKFPPPKMLK